MGKRGGTKRQKREEEAEDAPASKKAATDAPAEGEKKGDDTASQMAQMMSEIASLKSTIEGWKSAFREDIPEGSEEPDPVQIREKSSELRSYNTRLSRKVAESEKSRGLAAAALLQKQAEVSDLKRAVQHVKESTSPEVRQVSEMLIDPGLARQFRHMQSEVEQGREMMKEMQDQLVGVTYSADTFEAKQQVDRLHQLEKENAELKNKVKSSNITSLQNQVASLRKEVSEVQTQYKALQEYTRSLDKDYEQLQDKLTQLMALRPVTIKYG